MKKLWRRTVWSLLTVAILAAAAVSIPFLVPLERFIPELTRIAAEKLGQPVAISQLSLHLFPTPRAVARGVSVGKRSEVTVGELEIVPDLLSLLSGPKTIRLVRAEDVQVQEAALGFPAKMPKGRQGEDIRVQRVEIFKVKLKHSAVKLPEFDLRAELGEGFSLEVAKLETRDNALRVVVDPQSSGISTVSVEATKWTLPAGAPVRFEWLAAEGTLKGAQLDLPKVEGRLYGGKIFASLRLDWSRQWQVAGKARMEGVDVAPLQRVLGQKPQLTGKLNTEAVFSARARTPEQLANVLALDGPFEVVGGAYQGYDLTKISFKALEPGGSTPFDELKGSVQVRGKQIRVAGLCVRSPALVAGGNVDIAPDQKLAGKLDVSMSKTGGFVGMPVSLGGTVSEPSFSPTKGYVIGAVIGTVLLPGIGTSIGSSLGGRIEGTSDCK